MAAREKMPIFRAKIFNHISSRPRHNRGFTLLEVMVVLGIVVALVAMAIPRLSGSNNQMRQTVRKLSSITRQLQNTAKLKGAVYRIAIDLKDGPKANGQEFWIEASSARTVLTPEEMNDRPLDKDKKDEEKPPSLFSPDPKMMKPVVLPGGMHIEGVELKRHEGEITSGKAYIHFFPQGLADEAVIHLRGGEKLVWSLVIHPLTGKTDIATERVTLRDLQ